MDVVKTNIELLEGSLVIDSLPGPRDRDDPADAADAGDHSLPDRHRERRAVCHPTAGTGRGRLSAPRDEAAASSRRSTPRFIGCATACCRSCGCGDVLSRPQPFTAETKAEILAAHAASANIDPARIAYILVLRLPGRRFGLVVDEVRGTEEIVVKPMHASIKKVGIFTGATIMGDGRVASIADVAGIVEHARLSFDSAVESTAKASDARKSAQAHRVLLFEYGPHEQFALAPFADPTHRNGRPRPGRARRRSTNTSRWTAYRCVSCDLTR